MCNDCFPGDIERVEGLLSNEDVDINGHDSDGFTPLTSAVVRGDHFTVERLLEHPRIRLGKEERYGWTALHLACYYNRVAILQLLCQHSKCSPGVVNKKDSIGRTPLMRAVQRGHLDIVRVLDREDTDFFTKDRHGRTLIEVARKESHNEVLEYLIERSRIDSLLVIAAHNVARYVENKADLEALEIPKELRQYLARYVDEAQLMPGQMVAPGGASSPQQAVLGHGQEPLTASMLAAAPPQEQKQMLGERLFPRIQRMFPDLAGKITDKLLEIDNAELVHMLEDQNSLEGKVEEAVVVLLAHRGKAGDKK